MIKFSSNDIFWILLFLYYSFGVEKTNTFIRSRGSLENHTRFKTVIKGQNLYPFSDQNGSKTIPFGAAHTYIAYIGEYPPTPGLCGRAVFDDSPISFLSFATINGKKSTSILPLSLKFVWNFHDPICAVFSFYVKFTPFSPFTTLSPNCLYEKKVLSSSLDIFSAIKKN